MALLLAQEAVKTPEYATLSLDEKGFLLMPWMHAESQIVHQQATELFAELKGTSYYQSEQEHRQIIELFGRYPHRNQRLNRHSTPEEQASGLETERSAAEPEHPIPPDSHPAPAPQSRPAPQPARQAKAPIPQPEPPDTRLQPARTAPAVSPAHRQAPPEPQGRGKPDQYGTGT